MNGIICSWSTNGYSFTGLGRRGCAVPFGMVHAGMQAEYRAGSLPERGPCRNCKALSSPLREAALVSAWSATGVQAEAALASAPGVHQPVEDLGDGEDLLLADARRLL